MGVRTGGLAGTTVVAVPRLGSLADDWDSLVDAMPVPSPFLRSWWLEAVAGARPVFVLVRRGERLIGGLALQQEDRLRWPLYRVMGHGSLGPDHIDLLADPGEEETVVAAIGGWMRRSGSRFFDLVGVSDGSRLATALPAPVTVEPYAMAPWESLPADFDSYLKQRPSNLRNLVLRRTRRMEASGGSCELVAPAEVDRAIDTLRRLHDQQWGDRSGFMPVFDLFARAARRGVARGELRLYEARVQGRVVAVQVWFDVAGRFSFYQGGRDPDDSRWAAGTLLMATAIADACSRQASEADFLRGDEPYKAMWTSRQRPLLRLRSSSGVAARTLTTVSRSLDATPTGRRVKQATLSVPSRLRP